MLWANRLDTLTTKSQSCAANLGWSLAISVVYLLATHLALPRIESRHNNFKAKATQKAYHMLRLLSGVVPTSAISRRLSNL